MYRANLFFPENRIVNWPDRYYQYDRQFPINPQGISGLIIGRRLNDARLIYPNIRPVIVDGQSQAITLDFRQDRINVETNNGYITRIVGFY